jgi:hypothetical protein
VPHDGRTAGARHDRATPGRALRLDRAGAAAAGPDSALRRAVVRHAEGRPRPAHRGRPRPLLGARRADRAARRGAGGQPAGQGVQPRAADQDPPAGRGRQPLDRPEGLPGRAGRLRPARRRVADRQGRRRRPGRRRLRRPTAGRPAALDLHADGLPAARAGPQLRPGGGRGGVRPRARARRRRRHQDRPDARTGEGEERPAQPAKVVGGPSRFVRDAVEFAAGDRR